MNSITSLLFNYDYFLITIPFLFVIIFATISKSSSSTLNISFLYNQIISLFQPNSTVYSIYSDYSVEDPNQIIHSPNIGKRKKKKKGPAGFSICSSCYKVQPNDELSATVTIPNQCTCNNATFLSIFTSKSSSKSSSKSLLSFLAERRARREHANIINSSKNKISDRRKRKKERRIARQQELMFLRQFVAYEGLSFLYSTRKDGIPILADGTPIYTQAAQMNAKNGGGDLITHPSSHFKCALMYNTNTSSSSGNLVDDSDFAIIAPESARSVFMSSLKNWAFSLYCEFEMIPKRPFRDWTLTPDTNRLITTPNAGGNSVLSEALSFELLYRAFGARLTATEMEIKYKSTHTKKTDYVCIINGTVMGVSVTRAMKYGNEPYTTTDAFHLLKKKLAGVLCSNVSVEESNAWYKQLLHVWAADHTIASVIESTYENQIDPELKANTLLLITVASNPQLDFIFF